MKYLLFAILLAGCFTQKKAQRNFGRISSTYPEIPTVYCAERFGGKDTVIVGDTITHIDTVQQIEVKSDTVRKNDTIVITRTLPSAIITKTITRTDTIRTENKAALALCELNNRKMVDLLTKQTGLADGWHKKAKTRFWIILAMGAVIGVGVYSQVSGFFKPRI